MTSKIHWQEWLRRLVYWTPMCLFSTEWPLMFYSLLHSRVRSSYRRVSANNALPYENERGGSKTIKWGNKERLQVAATTSNTERLCYHCRLARIGRSYNCNIADVYCGLRTLLFMSWLRHCKSYENRIQFLTRVFIRIKSVFLYKTKKVKHITLKYITQNMK